MSGKPITPDEVSGQKQSSIPSEVFDAFNELIVKNYSGGRASVKQDDIVRLLVNKGFKSSEIYENGWLDVEPLYEQQGWKVTYDKPGFNESYAAYFVFQKKRK
jgi:hypothetical protein